MSVSMKCSATRYFGNNQDSVRDSDGVQDRSAETCSAVRPGRQSPSMLLPGYFAAWEDDQSFLGATAGGGDEPGSQRTR